MDACIAVQAECSAGEQERCESDLSARGASSAKSSSGCTRANASAAPRHSLWSTQAKTDASKTDSTSARAPSAIGAPRFARVEPRESLHSSGGVRCTGGDGQGEASKDGGGAGHLGRSALPALAPDAQDQYRRRDGAPRPRSWAETSRPRCRSSLACARREPSTELSTTTR